MSAIRNSFRGQRLPSVVATLVLSALLICGQAAEAAHEEIDCEHESCVLCVGAASDCMLVGDLEPPMAPDFEQRVAATVSTDFLSAILAHAQSIRGPPAP